MHQDQSVIDMVRDADVIFVNNYCFNEVGGPGGILNGHISSLLEAHMVKPGAVVACTARFSTGQTPSNTFSLTYELCIYIYIYILTSNSTHMHATLELMRSLSGQTRSGQERCGSSTNLFQCGKVVFPDGSFDWTYLEWPGFIYSKAVAAF